MAIRTIEDTYQYRVHSILHKFVKNKDEEVIKEFEEDAEAATWKYRNELGQYFVDDINEYCGAQEAYNNDY